MAKKVKESGEEEKVFDLYQAKVDISAAYGIKNLYVDRFRHNRKEVIPEEFPESITRPQEMEVVEWEMLLNSLPDGEGVIFHLRYMEGYNSSQIGEMLSLPSGTVRSKLSSARKHIKEAMGGKNYVR